MDKEILTNSSASTFRACPKKYYMSYVQGYKPVREGEPLIFGKIIHKGIEIWSEAHDLEAAINAMYDMAERTNNPDPYLTVKAVALMRGYHQRYEHEPYQVVVTEKDFKAPLLNPDSNAESRSFVLGGQVDAIIKHTVTERLLIREIKTTSENIEDSTSDYWYNLFLDSQVSQYYIGAEMLGYDISTCLYDVLRRPALKPYQATPEENRKYKADGTLYASQRATDETVEEFFDRVTADIAARPSYYYARREVPRLKEDLFEFMADVWGVAQTLLMFKRLNIWPRNTRSCISHYGTCAYFGVCSKRASLDDTSLFKKVDEVHQELKSEQKLTEVSK